MIIHLDLDCFFVSAERTRMIELANQAVVVCKSGDSRIFSTEDCESEMTEFVGGFNGLIHHKKSFLPYDKNGWKKDFIDENGKIHGIVIAKSYEAKKYGIKTGTQLRDALKMCPKLFIVHSDHLFYQQLSTKLKAFLKTKIPILEQYSIDEFWGDLQGWIKDEDVYDFIKNLQSEVLERFNLPLSIGASTSKWTAKVATDVCKPYGLKIVPKDKIISFVSPMLISDFPGIGKALQKKFKEYGIETLGDVLECEKMVSGWGAVGRDLVNRIKGVDNEPVLPFRERKSIGISRNFQPTLNRDEVNRRIIILCRHLSYTISKLGLSPTTYSFQIRYVDAQKSAHSLTVERIFSESMYKEMALKIFKQIDIYPRVAIMKLGLNVSNFTSQKQNKTFSLFDSQEDQKAKQLNDKLTILRDKYGIDIVRLAKEKSNDS